MSKKKKTEIAQVGLISDAIRRLAKKKRKLNTAIQVAHQHQLQSAMIAMEFGFRCCEKGMNLEAARIELAKHYD